MKIPKLCTDCGEPSAKLSRDRCRPCYDRLRRNLKKADAFAKIAKSRPLLDRLLEKTTPGHGGCVIWTGSTYSNGYGQTSVGRSRKLLAHRAAYELLVGPIPPGLVIDHACHNRDASCPGGPCLHRRCINPHHLEAVTPQNNLLRSPLTLPGRNTRKTTCTQGHPFDEVNTYIRPGSGDRVCRQCAREARRDAYRAARMATAPCGQFAPYGLRPCTRLAGHEGGHNCKAATR